MTTELKLINWLLNGETGMSSKCIAEVYMLQNSKPKNNNHPHDPSDLLRCMKLIETIPEIKNCFNYLAEVSKEWGLIVKHWDELTNLLTKELEISRQSAPHTHGRMKEIFRTLKT